MPDEHPPALQEYHSLLIELLTQISTQFPDVKVSALLAACTAMNEEQVAASIDKHVDHLMSPLTNVSYSAPLGRLRQKSAKEPWTQATLYDAYIYSDADALLSCEHPVLQILDLEALWSNTEDDAESRAAIFDFLRAIGSAALRHRNIEEPAHITVAQIEEEIENGAQASPADIIKLNITSIVSRVRNASSPHEDHLQKVEDFLEKCDTAAVINEWQAMAECNADGKSMADAIADKDATLAQNLLSSFDGDENCIVTKLLPALFDCPDEIVEQAWPELAQIGLLCRIHKGTPSHLVDIISSKANTIAHKIADGSFNMDNSMIQQIGEDIMTQCSAEDLEMFSNMISGELEQMLQQDGTGLMEMAASGGDASGVLQMLMAAGGALENAK